MTNNLVPTILYIAMTMTLVPMTSPTRGQGSMEEWCHFETFRAACDAANQVILMDHAYFGRMELGRCVKTNFGFVGCHSSVLDLLDRKCSGRPACQVEVVEPNFEGIFPCNVELKSYLQAQYSCIAVPSAVPTTCVLPVSSEPLYIPNPYLRHVHPLQDPPCGTSAAPWILRALPGQFLNMTLLDLSWSARGGAEDPLHMCNSYGSLTERGRWRNSEDSGRDICSLTSQRFSHVMTSRGHELELVVHSPGAHHFILITRALGCPDLTGLSSGHVVEYKEERQTAQVRCQHTKQTWHLACDSNLWQGVVDNCTYTVKQPHSGNTQKKIFSTAMLVVIVVAVSLLMCLSILLLGVLCYRRFNDKRKYSRPHPHPEELLMAPHCKDSACAFTPSSEAPPLCQAPDVTQLDSSNHTQVQCQIYHAIINNECPYMRVVQTEAAGGGRDLHTAPPVYLPSFDGARSLVKQRPDARSGIRESRHNVHHNVGSRSIDAPHYCKYRFNEDNVDPIEPPS